jgi:hypothetical protein
MKSIILLLCLVPFTVHGLNRPEIDKLLATAATAKGQPYLDARQAVLDLGTNALPLLAQAAVDAGRTWQQRLVARIFYERITRGADIESLRRYDWRTHPQYDKEWERNILGVGFSLGKVAVPKCAEVGLWYYYIELAWKETAEYAIEPRDSRINETANFSLSWLGWCVIALEGQPEHQYLVQALAERLESDASLSEPLDLDYYRYLLRHQETNAVPVLVERYGAYNKHEDKENGLEVFPGARAITYRGVFKPILSFADSRHADLIAKFIDEKPALAPLKEKLDEVRKRPAPPPLVEPPFRLNHQRPLAR